MLLAHLGDPLPSHAMLAVAAGRRPRKRSRPLGEPVARAGWKVQEEQVTIAMRTLD